MYFSSPLDLSVMTLSSHYCDVDAIGSIPAIIDGSSYPIDEFCVRLQKLDQKLVGVYYISFQRGMPMSVMNTSSCHDGIEAMCQKLSLTVYVHSLFVKYNHTYSPSSYR